MRLISTRNRIILNRLHLEEGTFRLWFGLFVLQGWLRRLWLDTRYWKALGLYRQREAGVDESRRRFQELQRELGREVSLRSVIDNMQEEIETLNVTTF